MALTRRAPAATFEEPKTTPPAAAAAKTDTSPPFEETKTETAAAAPAPAAVPAPAAALVIQVPKSLVVQNMQAGHSFMDSLKDALRVDWDTLNRLKASQGRIAFGDVNLGEWIEFSLLSWQDNWLVSPGKDTDEAKSLAKYSDDGKTIKDTGEDINVYMQRLKDMDYPDCRLGKRCVLAFELIDCDKDAAVDEGMLFQADLAPTSRAAFERYRIQSALDIGKSRATGDEVIRIRATATIKKNGKNEYTQLDFTRAK